MLDVYQLNKLYCLYKLEEKKYILFNNKMRFNKEKMYNYKINKHCLL